MSKFLIIQIVITFLCKGIILLSIYYIINLDTKLSIENNKHKFLKTRLKL